jgi:hypothetical protein
MFFIIMAVILFTSGCSPAKVQLPEGTIINESLEGSPELTLAAGHYKVVVSTGGVTTIEEEGSYVLKGDQITFTTEKSSDLLVIGCTSSIIKTPYTYKWTYDRQAKALTFANVDDHCDLRKSRRESGPWLYKTSGTS